MIPPHDELTAIVWERSRDVPLGQILDRKQVRLLRRVVRGKPED
jgi:hypothetical protein